MNRTVRHVALGALTGLTVFAIVVPLIHLLAELVVFAGLQLGTWDNPVEIFIFLVTAAVVGLFPWGLWILLTDARKANMFDVGHEVVAYSLAAMGVHLILTLLACTIVQAAYAQFRWVFTPALLVCATVLISWRWKNVWGFSTRISPRNIVDQALALEHDS